MSHEITKNKDGSAAAIYARTPAWHRLGTVVDNLFTAKEALLVAGLDYGVDTAPVYAQVTGDDGQTLGVMLPDHRMTFRMLDGEVVPLGVVSSEYVPINPMELFGFLDDVVDAVDGSHYTAAFALRNWTQVVCVADMGAIDLDPNGRADKVAKYIVGRTSHDGSLAFGLKWSNMRVECANMLAMHLREAQVEWKTKHTKMIRNRVEQAKITLGLWNNYEGAWLANAQTMVQAEIDSSGYDKWLTGLFEEVRKSTDADEVDREAMYSVRALYDYGTTCKSINGTVWGALNAATEYSDWMVEARGSKKTTEDESRFLRQMGDTSGKYGQSFKQTAWEWSLSYIEEKIADSAKKQAAKQPVKAAKKKVGV